MLVIKMLKKASNKNNIELAEYLRKTRNTIASWENDENCIPNTEKRKISTRFDFDCSYWDVGLDKTISFYQKMYSDIKNGYLKDLRKQDIECESRIEEILRYCDSTIPYNEDRENTDMKFEMDNEEKHFNYIKSLLNDVVASNSDGKHIISIVYDEKRVVDSLEIMNISNTLDNDKEYFVSLGYDDYGFINTITIV